MFYSKKLRSVLQFCLFFILISHNSYLSAASIEATSANFSVQDQGYTKEQLKAMARAQGVSASDIESLESQSNSETSQDSSIDTSLNITPAPTESIMRVKVPATTKKDSLFGYNFFNNQNISFQPNLNLATPENYQLGPGDGLVISLWGAAENTYDVEVDRNGAIKLPNIGPIVVSGLSINDAEKRIKSSLKRVYAGISAPDSSPYKIFTNISLAKVRTVQVDIIGEVKVPGTYSLSALSTVLNALYASGGPTKNGTFREIKLVRNGQETSLFDIYKYLIDGSQDGNKTLQDQDVIIVGSYISRIGITGAVKRPGTYEIKESETLQDLIRFVSGFTSNAYKENIKLTRIEGDRKRIKEVSLNNFRTSRLFDGDRIEVGEIINEVENRITINGSVYRPGDFEYTNNISLLELINKASGVLETTYLGRGLIVRQERKSDERVIIPFSVTEILNENNNIILKPNDVVQIFDESVVKDAKEISIMGAVNKPTTIQYVDGLKLEDLVVMAGGYAKTANSEVIEVVREVIDGDYNTINKIFKVSADKVLDLSNNTPFIFKPNDRIIVRYLKGSGEQSSVAITGEVNYPGLYYAENKNEKILDLINKAGGLSPYAFVDGATLIRKNPYYNELALNLTFDAINVDGDESEGNEGSDELNDTYDELNNKKEFRVGIDLRKILEEGEDSKQNLILVNGDKLVIPSQKETIKVEGEVLLPTMVRFTKKEKLKDYIFKSGGFSVGAKKSKVYVVHPNGDVASTKSFLFIRTYPKVKPGSIIFVPKKKPNPNKLSTQEVVGLSTGFATLALLIERLFN